MHGHFPHIWIYQNTCAKINLTAFQFSRNEANLYCWESNRIHVPPIHKQNTTIQP